MGCGTAVLKFCRHRWLENVNVSNCALQLWPHMKAYIELVCKGELPDLKTQSFEVVKNSAQDPLFIPKVMIFNSIA